VARGHLDAGRTAEAITLLEQVRDGTADSLGPDHIDTLLAAQQLGIVCWKAGRLADSVPLFEDLLGRYEGQFGRGDIKTLFTVANLGVNYRDAGRLDKAIPLLEEAYRASRTHPELRWVRAELLFGYGRAGQTADVTALLAEARAAAPKDSPELADLLVQAGQALLAAGAWADAEPVLRDSLAIREKLIPDDWLRFNSMSALGGALLGLGRYADAEPLLLRGYDGMKQREATIPPAGKIRLREAVERIGRLYEATAQPERAREWRQKLPPEPALPPREK
jgi:tetratricopeptide (TPR) repeat protein